MSQTEQTTTRHVMDISSLVHSSPRGCEEEAGASRKRRVQFSEYVQCRSVKPRLASGNENVEVQHTVGQETISWDWSAAVKETCNQDESELEEHSDVQDEVTLMKSQDGPAADAVVTEVLILKLVADRMILKTTVRDIIHKSASILAGGPATDLQVISMCYSVHQRLVALIGNIQLFGRAPLLPSQQVLGGGMLAGLQFLLGCVGSAARAAGAVRPPSPAATSSCLHRPPTTPRAQQQRSSITCIENPSSPCSPRRCLPRAPAADRCSFAAAVRA
mmetsp:Transcript_72654/g.194185  ORF Transcript_72654/g.194185 Transcript_72654/m.194185 type:complete len:275 (-) Transcript_72654:37-861(-)